MALIGLDNILRFGAAEVNSGYMDMVEEVSGLDKIEALQVRGISITVIPLSSI